MVGPDGFLGGLLELWFWNARISFFCLFLCGPGLFYLFLLLFLCFILHRACKVVISTLRADRGNSREIESTARIICGICTIFVTAHTRCYLFCCS